MLGAFRSFENTCAYSSISSTTVVVFEKHPPERYVRVCSPYIPSPKPTPQCSSKTDWSCYLCCVAVVEFASGRAEDTGNQRDGGRHATSRLCNAAPLLCRRVEESILLCCCCCCCCCCCRAWCCTYEFVAEFG